MCLYGCCLCVNLTANSGVVPIALVVGHLSRELPHSDFDRRCMQLHLMAGTMPAEFANGYVLRF